jgi:hypothetical protein
LAQADKLNEPSLSASCLAAAAAIRDIRARLYKMVQEGHWPSNRFADISTVLVDGKCVANSLTRLGTDMQSTHSEGGE